MFELDHLLAQNIVDRAMAILPCNVNVMDSQGLILGSGEAGRINTRHEGAQLVLANQRVVEINDPSALTLKGVQPGVNVPLMHDGLLIGVLGLSGDPKALRTYAELLRMTAEMLVSRQHHEVEHQWRKKRRDELLGLLLSDAGDLPRLLDEAINLGLKPELSRTSVMVETTSVQAAVDVSDWLSSRMQHSWCLNPSPHCVLWCYPAQNKVCPENYIKKLEAQGWPVLRMAVGVAAQDLVQLRKVCARLTALTAYGRAIRPGQKLLLLRQYRLPTMLWANRKDDATVELLAIVERVRSEDTSGHLIQTLRSWCEHNGQNQICANALGVHRNSLRYRMDRIAEITEMDLTKLDDVMTLYLGVQMLAAGD